MTDSLCKKRKLADSFIPCDEWQLKQSRVWFRRSTGIGLLCLLSALLLTIVFKRIRSGALEEKDGHVSTDGRTTTNLLLTLILRKNRNWRHPEGHQSRRTEVGDDNKLHIS